MASAFKWKLTDTLYSYLTDEHSGQPIINSGLTVSAETLISEQVLANFSSEQAYAAQFQLMKGLIASNPETAGVSLLSYSYYYDMNDNSCGLINGSVGDRGSQGIKGDKGDRGDDGEEGRGIKDIDFQPIYSNGARIGTRVIFEFTKGSPQYQSFDVMNGGMGGNTYIDYNYLLSGLTNMGLPEQIINTLIYNLYPDLQEYFDRIFAGALADINALKRALSGLTHDVGSLNFFFDYLSGQTGILAQYYDADHQALNTIDARISAVSGVAYINMSRVDALNSAITRVGQEMNVMSGYIRNYVEEVKILDEATCSFTRDMSEIYQTARYIEHTVEHLDGEVRDLSDQVQTASSMTTTISHQVSGLITDMSIFQQTYSSITSDVLAFSGEVANATRIAQNAYGIAMQAFNTVCGVTHEMSEFTITYSGIEGKVDRISGDTHNATRLAQNAYELSLESSRRVGSAQTEIGQLRVSYSGIEGRVDRMSGDVENATRIAQHADNISLTAKSMSESALTDCANLWVAYSNITMEVRDVSADVRSVIEQTATAITAYVYNQLEEKTGIDIRDGSITLDAEKTIITGELSFRDPESGIILYDNQGNIVVNINNKQIGTPTDSSIVQQTARASAANPGSWVVTTSRINIGKRYPNDSVSINDIRVMIYAFEGNRGVRPNTNSGQLLINVWNSRGQSVYNTTVNLTYSNSYYRYNNAVTTTFSAEEIYSVSFTTSFSAPISNDQLATALVYYTVSYGKQLMTRIGSDGMYANQSEGCYFLTNADGHTMKMKDNGLRVVNLSSVDYDDPTVRAMGIETYIGDYESLNGWYNIYNVKTYRIFFTVGQFRAGKVYYNGSSTGYNVSYVYDIDPSEGIYEYIFQTALGDSVSDPFYIRLPSIATTPFGWKCRITLIKNGSYDASLRIVPNNEGTTYSEGKVVIIQDAHLNGDGTNNENHGVRFNTEYSAEFTCLGTSFTVNSRIIGWRTDVDMLGI